MKKPAKKKKNNPKVASINSFKANKELITALEIFLEYTPPNRLSRNLRKMFMLWLDYEKDGLPLDFDDFIIDLYFLFEFLDTAESELENKL